MAETVKILLYGLGYIGSSIAKLILEKKGLQVVGAVDIADDKIGKDVGEVLGLETRLGIRVSRHLPEALRDQKAEVAIHATSSRITETEPQIFELTKAGLHIISTCEELAYPFYRHKDFARSIDQEARNRGVTILGTGINPGFVLDFLILSLSSVCQKIQRIAATRVVDASLRRPALQTKIGAGLTEQQFQEGVIKGTIGHVGLTDSVAMIADGLGVELDSITETIEPKLPDRNLQTDDTKIAKDQVAGVHQVGFGWLAGESFITLILEIYVGAKDPLDSVLIEGVPYVHFNMRGGIPGDQATAAIVVNSIPKVMKAKPGLVTVKDLPPASLILGDFAALSRNAS